MNQKIICFVLAILMMFSSSVVVFASETEESDSPSNTTEESGSIVTTSPSSALDTDSLGSTTSLQLMYAAMQLEMSETVKEQSLTKMDQIAILQEEQKLIVSYLNIARQCQSEAKSSDAPTEMPGDMAAYMTENELVYDTTGGDLLMTYDEWDTAITSLDTHLTKIGASVQREMILLQDYIGQYNSYMQGTNTQTSNTNQTLTSLAKGQSMYGDSEAGLALTSLVVGLALGCVLTLTVQKLHRKNDKV
ncbi:MAG: hypothetical protein IKL38_06545 [Firmicutes bacterium]|nr:hypothetical protein [Bacillota bacterium]